MILIGATIAAHKFDGTAHNWLTWVDDWRTEYDIHTFLSLELPITRELPAGAAALVEKVDSCWRWTLNDGATEISSSNRLRRIVAGRNYIIDKALSMSPQPSHVLFLDTDLTPDKRTLDVLLNMNYPVTGGNVPKYVLSGTPLRDNPEIQQHMNTAGYLLVQTELLSKLRWRYDPAAHMSDDPCFHADCTNLGYPTRVHHGLTGEHASLAPLERRGTDLRA